MPKAHVFYQILLAFTFLSTLLLPACEKQTPQHSFTFETMGTEASCNLMLPSSTDPKTAESIVRNTFSQVNTALSTWSPDSEISRLNRAPSDSMITLSPLLKTCLVVSQAIQVNSKGAFDPTAESLMRLWGFYRRQGVLPSSDELNAALADLGHWHLTEDANHIIKDKPGTRFDLGGIAKGMAVDLAAAKLRKAGIRNGLVDLGGNLYCLGGASGRNNWRVGIRNPHNRHELFATVTISNESIATSGSYERFVTIDDQRYGHIMNPATGRPAEGLLSATVIASEGILADGLSTTLFVLGPEKAMDFLTQFYPKVEAVLVIPTADGEKDLVAITPGLAERFALISGFEEHYQLVTDH